MTNDPNVPPELLFRMMAIMRLVAADLGSSASCITEARAIVTLLPPEKDPLMVEAREILAKTCERLGYPDTARQARDGKIDNTLDVQSTLAALRSRENGRG